MSVGQELTAMDRMGWFDRLTTNGMKGLTSMHRMDRMGWFDRLTTNGVKGFNIDGTGWIGWGGSTGSPRTV